MGHVDYIDDNYTNILVNTFAYLYWFGSHCSHYLGFKGEEAIFFMKRVFGRIEAIFDVLYLLIAFIIGIYLILSSTGDRTRLMAGIMALTLAVGDAFHLVPRIVVINTGQEEVYRHALGIGKQVTSITMTVFYILLWHVGRSIYALEPFGLYTFGIYGLALIRIVLCIVPQNRWIDRYPPTSWGIYRNIPFFIIGMIVSILFYQYRNLVPSFNFAYLAILLSFSFYLPVVLYASTNRKIGMLMLPKTLMYVWLLVMCLSI